MHGNASHEKIHRCNDNVAYSLLSLRLKDNGIAVLHASNGKDALRRFHSVSIDLCLIDICVPDMRGIDLMRTIKRSRSRAGIIMMTGSFPADDEMKAIVEHALFYLVKPIDPFQMKAVMEEFLGNALAPIRTTIS